jgi:hypothetical protein
MTMTAQANNPPRPLPENPTFGPSRPSKLGTESCLIRIPPYVLRYAVSSSRRLVLTIPMNPYLQLIVDDGVVTVTTRSGHARPTEGSRPRPRSGTRYSQTVVCCCSKLSGVSSGELSFPSHVLMTPVLVFGVNTLSSASTCSTLRYQQSLASPRSDANDVQALQPDDQEVHLA